MKIHEFYRNFFKDYDRSNPISQNKAMNEWLKYFMMLENANIAGENAHEILEKIDEEEKQNKGFFEGVKNYALFNHGLQNIQNLGYLSKKNFNLLKFLKTE